jgi:hypothetical protein
MKKNKQATCKKRDYWALFQWEIDLLKTNSKAHNNAPTLWANKVDPVPTNHTSIAPPLRLNELG